MLNQYRHKKIWVITSKMAYMQRIADYVRTGHQAYIRGVTATEKIHQTWDKLVLANPVYDDKLKAFRARKAGYATGRLLMYQDTNAPDKVHWILLVHGRKEQLPTGERWLHAEDPHSRIHFSGYELLRVTKAGQTKPSWTWRYGKQRYENLRDAIVQAIRSRRDQDLKRHVDVVAGTAGFSGSREQAKALIQLVRSEWARRRPGEDYPGELPKLIGWTRRKADKGVFLTRTKQEPPKSKHPMPPYERMFYELLEAVQDSDEARLP